MLKHIEDGADFNMLIEDGGGLLVACSKCKKVWTGTLTLARSPGSTKEVTRRITTALGTNPLVLEEFGIDEKTISALQLK